LLAMGLYNTRRGVLMVLLFFLIVFSFASYTSGYEYWLQWITLTVMIGLLFITDLMFLSDNTFVFDPNFRSWESSQGGSSY